MIFSGSCSLGLKRIHLLSFLFSFGETKYSTISAHSQGFLHHKCAYSVYYIFEMWIPMDQIPKPEVFTVRLEIQKRCVTLKKERKEKIRHSTEQYYKQLKTNRIRVLNRCIWVTDTFIMCTSFFYIKPLKLKAKTFLPKHFCSLIQSFIHSIHVYRIFNRFCAKQWK